MDVTQITQIALGVGIIALSIGLFSANVPKIRQRWLKYQVRKQLMKLPTENIEVIHDFMIPTAQGLCALDAVVIAPQGIFLIQTVNYVGKIYGNDWKKKWLQKTRFGKQTFANPFYQLHTDGVELERILALNHDDFIAITVFPRGAKLEVLGQQQTIHAKQLATVIQEQQEQLVTPEEIKQSTQILQRINITVPLDRQRLYQRMQEIEKVAAEKIHNGICPQCGSILIVKNSPTGYYKHCSNSQCQFEVH